MMKNKYKIVFFYTLSSLLLTYVILGKNNISPTSDNWMLQGDAASNLVAWKYFFNDIYIRRNYICISDLTYIS